MQPEIPKIDFSNPLGAEALFHSDSVSWQVYKNPISLFIGGIAAVLLELAEPRVRSGVWNHSIFSKNPMLRLRRTGLTTSVAVYAPAATAERMIQAVDRMHSKVEGTTPNGDFYHAKDPELLNWVQATVGFGFLEAYSMFVRELSENDRNQFYKESIPMAQLFGAHKAPQSITEQEEQFAEMRPLLEPHPIISEFLEIMWSVPALPRLLRPLQRMCIKAGVEVLPDWVIDRLQLEPKYKLSNWERRIVSIAGRIGDRTTIRSSPAVQASLRMGLPANHLYRR